MKSGVWGLIFLISMISASVYFPQPGVIFGFKSSECNNNGTIYLNLTHDGNSVAFKEVKFSIEGDNLPIQKMEGTWFYGKSPVDLYDYPADNYTGNDFFGRSRINFRSTNNIYTEGKYIITLIWPSNSIYYDHIKFAVQCPGISCNSSNDCVNQQSCTDNKCQWITCSSDKFATGHTCLPKCNDYNICTNDIYSDGKCTYTKVEGCCSKNEDCKPAQACKDGDCIAKGDNVFTRLWNWLKSKYQ